MESTELPSASAQQITAHFNLPLGDEEADLVPKISCLECRAAKRRCQSDGANSICQRCSKQKLACVYKKHRRGRTRKSTSLNDPVNSLADMEIQAPTANNVNDLLSQLEPAMQPIPSVAASSPRLNFAAVSQSITNAPAIQFSHTVPDGDSSPYTSAGALANRPSVPVQAHSTQLDPPDPVQAGILTEADAIQLFDYYFSHLNVTLCVLDPALHTFNKTREKSTLLVTVVLTVTSRSKRPNIYPVCLALANKLVGCAFGNGACSVELIQALILLAHWKLPEDDTSWRRIGYAIRLALELRLDQKRDIPKNTSEPEVRAILNRERTWLSTLMPLLVIHLFVKRAPDLIISDYHLAIHHSLPRMISDDSSINIGDRVSSFPELRPLGESSLAPLVHFSRLCRLYADSIATMTTSDSAHTKTLKWIEEAWKRWRHRWLFSRDENLILIHQQLSNLKVCDAYFRFHVAEYKLLYVARFSPLSTSMTLDMSQPNDLSFAFHDCMNAAFGVATVFHEDFASHGYLQCCFQLLWISLAVTSVWLVKNAHFMLVFDRARVMQSLNEIAKTAQQASNSADDMPAFLHRLLKHLLSSLSASHGLQDHTVGGEQPSNITPPQNLQIPSTSTVASDAWVLSDRDNTHTAHQVESSNNESAAHMWMPSTAQQVILDDLWIGSQSGPSPWTRSGTPSLQHQNADSTSLPLFDGSAMYSHLRQLDEPEVTDSTFFFPEGDDSMWRLLFPAHEGSTLGLLT